MTSQMMSQNPEKRIRTGPGSKNGIEETATLTSNLGADLIEHIISFLPIEPAVRCGTLSTRFRDSWRSSRNLIFDVDFTRGRDRENIIRAVHSIFYKHSGPKIQTFHLYLNPTYIEGLVESWLQRAILKGVEEVDLDFSPSVLRFVLPSRLLEAESIRSLKLTFCRLELPPNSIGFSFLKTLVLRRVDIASSNILAMVFSNCLILECFELLQCPGIFHLNVFGQHLKRLVVEDSYGVFDIMINAPILSTLFFRGIVYSINFHTPMVKLDEVTLDFRYKEGFPYSCEVGNLMMGLSFINLLKISTGFLEKLSSKYMAGGMYRTLQFFLWNVKEFHLISEATSCINPNDIVFLLQNCPCLERVFLDLGEFCFEAGNYWEIYSKYELEECHPAFRGLKKIVVKGFKLEHLEMQMLEFFLSKSRNLESIALVPSENYQSEALLHQPDEFDQLFTTWKASPKTKIRIFENMQMFKLWSF